MKKATSTLLDINKLSIDVGTTHVVHELDLRVHYGELHVIMGPNGSGKSSLGLTLAGHPSYVPTSGSATFLGQNLLDESPDVRAKNGLFLAFQYPVAIPGVSVGNFLRQALVSQQKPTHDLRKEMFNHLKQLNMDKSVAARSINDGFSGGEKKRLELLQMHILQPRLVILDEIDSGLDVDGIKVMAQSINSYRRKDRAIILITHYAHLLESIVPDLVHIMIDGRIVQSGDVGLAKRVQLDGYSGFSQHKVVA